MNESRYFHSYKSGRLSVIGFDATGIEDRQCAVECQDHLVELLERHHCDMLVVDLTSVSVVSSWILGLLAAVGQRGIDVQLYHLSDELDGVLQVTRLDKFLSKRGFCDSGEDVDQFMSCSA